MAAKLQLLTEQERPYHQYRTQQLQQAVIVALKQGLISLDEIDL